MKNTNIISSNFNNHYDYWVFDLDNTIYDFNLGLFRRISQRMTEYIKDFFQLNQSEALNLQKSMYRKYGLTLRGLMIEKEIDPEKILTSMGIFEEFEMIFDIKDSNYIAKPDQSSYLMMKEKFGFDNENIKRSIFFEDTAKNLKPASELGMSTVWIENDFNKEEANKLRKFINFTGSDIKSILTKMLRS